MRLAFLVVLVGCGDNSRAELAPVPAFETGCKVVPVVGEMFTSPADFEGEIVRGTLADWDLDGRWFYRGAFTALGSSIHFEKRGREVIVNRAAASPVKMTADVIFQRGMSSRMEPTTLRISNHGPDGGARADVAICYERICQVCTLKLVRAERHDAQASDKLSLLGELRGASWKGDSFNVRVVDDLAYLVGTDGLRIIDVSDLAHPVERGHYATSSELLNDVKIVDAGDKRYAILATIPVDVVDVTNPSAPVLTAQIPEEAHTVFTETRGGLTYAYFGNYDGTAPVYDVTDPKAPVRRGRFDAVIWVHDLSVVDGMAYLNSLGRGFLAVDFTTPSAPVLTGEWEGASGSHSNWTTNAGGRHIALHGEEGYAAHLDVVDIDAASPTYMQPFGSYKTRDEVSIHNIMAFGTKGYVTYYQDGVRVLDLADPANPKLVGYFNTWDPQGAASTSHYFQGAIGLDVDVARKLIFVADMKRGLLILRDDT